MVGKQKEEPEIPALLRVNLIVLPYPRIYPTPIAREALAWHSGIRTLKLLYKIVKFTNIITIFQLLNFLVARLT